MAKPTFADDFSSYTPAFHEPEYDTVRRLADHGEHWSSRFGRCVIASCDEWAVDTSCRCAEHTSGAGS